ncbi:esterase [Skermanella stibiiresistens SB22]|uniref:Esterase n=1 Tax=Skermanella stibiiresistens SB22 TaxID=1385369 RepID=W9HD40_9PROT|nr:PHB depolymerase family esterase [Skermanella stibiiresistens]EWY42626.1 esterase [Skermanella stibiiresistens SB22]
MTNLLSPGMAEAMRLTSAGQLTEATALIQRLLQGGDAPAPESDGAKPNPPTGPGSGPGTIIDMEPVSPGAAAFRFDAKPASRPRSPHRAVPLTGLGETLRGLAARSMPSGLNLGGMGLDGLNLGGMGLRPASAPLPDGASFETLSHTNAAGTRSYKLYIPAKRAAEPMPLIVMLHGCTQSPDDFAAGTRMNELAEEHGFLVAYPAQPSSANPQKCWNWFKPEDQRRDHGEPSLLAGIARQIIGDHPVDPSRVYVAGLSAGAATAAILGATYPDVFAAVGVHSGLPVGAARDIPSAFAAMGQGGSGGGAVTRLVPTIVFHGDKDMTVNPRNGDAVVAQSTAAAKGLKSTVERGNTPNGRAHDRTVLTDGYGRTVSELWTIHGAGHAWAGGSASGTYTDPKGPDASREMLRFFLEHRVTAA